MLRTEAIKAFLTRNTHSDLSSMYNADMECQVNVAQDGGERIRGEYQGKIWNGFTDGINTWKPIRIPYNANTDPSYEDKPISFSLDQHAEGRGMRGWDWANRLSRWVAYDFDALIGHSERHPSKLTNEQLNDVRDAASKLPWTTIRRSTSGKGLHIYVNLEPFPTANHTEHAALARSILHYMCLQTGFPFESAVDICGYNMWVWHRKMIGTDGLTLIKQGEIFAAAKVPTNWRDHLLVTRGQSKRIRPSFSSPELDDLSGQKRHLSLDDGHKALITWLAQKGASFWWDQDHHMLVAHTFDLAAAHKELGLRGAFSTLSTGKDQGIDHNCFLYPLRRGAWVVRRYSKGVAESDTWDVDVKGFSRCYYNQDASLKVACKANNGVEHPTGGFVFRTGVEAATAAKILGVDLALPDFYAQRETKLKQNRQGRLVVELKREIAVDASAPLNGWLAESPKKYTKIFDNKIDEPEVIDVDDYDDIIRHTVSESGISLGWVIQTEKQWTDEPLSHVNILLKSMGLRVEESSTVLGNNIAKPWQLVNRPFQPEYGGDRCWNRGAAQYRYPPNLDKDIYNTPTWDMILHHVGSNLDDAVSDNSWCRENGLTTGADYLRCWIASVFQKPYEQLPYLFLWGEQNTGKSILHEALGLLMTKGYVRADMALQGDFNGELERAVLCVVEETDLQRNMKADNKIKDYVTSLQ